MLSRHHTRCSSERIRTLPPLLLTRGCFSTAVAAVAVAPSSLVEGLVMLTFAAATAAAGGANARSEQTGNT